MIYKQKSSKRFSRRLSKLNHFIILYLIIFIRYLFYKWSKNNLNNDLIHIFITKAFYYDYITM
jgi:hypothetical protein